MILKYYILVFTFLLIYFGFLCTSKKVFRDYGSCREKVEYSTFGIKSLKIYENTISEFVSKENIQNPEKWALTSEFRLGFFNIETYGESYRVNRESLIEQLEASLASKLKEKNDDSKYIIEVLKPYMKKFLEYLTKRDLEELNKIILLLDQE